jgi:hypothetical protein
MATAEKDAVSKAKRNTGDWRGLPNVLGGIAILGIIGVPIGAALVYDSSGVPGGVVATAIFSGWFSCLGMYAVAAIIAALRGILNK